MAEQDQGERTEAPTPKRRDDFREKGQIAKSKEIPSVIMLLGAVIYFYFAGDFIFEKMFQLWTVLTRMSSWLNLDLNGFMLLFRTLASLFFSLLLPMFIIMIFLALLPNAAQTKFLISVKSLEPDPNRINPISRFQEMFLNPKILIDTGINILKLVILATSVYLVISSEFQELPRLLYMEPYQILQTILIIVLKIIFVTALLFVTVAIVDYIHQWYQLEKKMRMTKQEVKDEYKQQEGDPHMRGHIRNKMREISLNKLIETVPTSDVIVTNPTHIAIALRYDPELEEAPRVMAKGKGFWAERIKVIAAEHDIEIVEDKLLARSLYKSVKLGRQIPMDLYRAVAEILAYVYKLKKERKAAGGSSV